MDGLKVDFELVSGAAGDSRVTVVDGGIIVVYVALSCYGQDGFDAASKAIALIRGFPQYRRRCRVELNFLWIVREWDREVARILVCAIARAFAVGMPGSPLSIFVSLGDANCAALPDLVAELPDGVEGVLFEADEDDADGEVVMASAPRGSTVLVNGRRLA